VNLETTPEFIKAGAAAVAAGGELVDAKALRESNLDVITSNARKFVEAVRLARMAMA
jgi:2-keto-3-deoxy-6-phosphogluconate aldolase